MLAIQDCHMLKNRCYEAEIGDVNNEDCYDYIS